MSAFSPRQMFLLDLACKPIDEAFGGGLFLVGTAISREGQYRDVDVRLMLEDDRFDRITDAVGADAVTFLSLAIGEYLHSQTGMPIDFQIQRQTEANERHTGMRNPVGVRSLSNFRGDGVPEEVKESRKPSLSESDFHTKWDGDRIFSFVESENANILTYGHVDKEALVNEVFEYDKLCDPKEAKKNASSDVLHLYAVLTEDPPEWRISWQGVEADTPSSFPISVIRR